MPFKSYKSKYSSYGKKKYPTKFKASARKYLTQNRRARANPRLAIGDSAYAQGVNIPRPEIKVNYSVGGNSFGNTTTWHAPVAVFLAPVQGVTANQRIGNRVNAKWLDINLTYACNDPSNVPPDGNTIFADIWLDRRNNQTNVTAAQIYNDPSVGAMTFPNSSNVSRFKLLRRVVTPVDVLSVNAATGDPSSIGIIGYNQLRIPLNMLITSSFGTTDIEDNSVWITCVCQRANLSNNIVMTMSAAMYFSDA